MIRCPISNDS